MRGRVSTQIEGSVGWDVGESRRRGWGRLREMTMSEGQLLGRAQYAGDRSGDYANELPQRFFGRVIDAVQLWESADPVRILRCVETLPPS